MSGPTTDLSIALDQRGRASVDFIGLLGRRNNALREHYPAIAEAAGFGEEALDKDIAARAEQLAPVMEANPLFQTQQLLGEYHARNHGPIAAEAFHRVKEGLPFDIEGDCTLHLDPDLERPSYWEGVDYHRTHGGWDLEEHTGYIHAEIVHRRMVEKIFPGGIFKMRRVAAGRAPRDHYDTICELGCSTGHYTQALAETYPDAAITGVDLSHRGLEHCARVGNARGAAWTLHQRPAEDTQLPEASFDLVTSYILLHEIPASVLQEVFDEAFRLLKPGGDLLMADVTRFADMSKIAVWRQDLIARMGGEPYWRETAQLDLAEIARNAGFEEARAEGIFPHIVQGRKPLV
ncbi:MAG: class I SAM-dependent methyltransferase [Pseudomonadota bacterium]